MILKKNSHASSFLTALTFFTSIPMLMHVGPKQECLLFAPPPPIKYGGPGGRRCTAKKLGFMYFQKRK
jgi:hypothetical protein